MRIPLRHFLHQQQTVSRFNQAVSQSIGRHDGFHRRVEFFCYFPQRIPWLDKRLKAHNEGKGAKYTRGRRPVSLAYYEIFETKEEAMQREAAIKRLSRKDKLDLVAAFTSDASYATN